MKRLLNQKFSPKIFGPYLIKAKVGKVAYWLKLSLGHRIHPTLHISQLKKHVWKTPSQANLPLVGADKAMTKESVRVMDRWIVKKGNQVVTNVLVKWVNMFLKDLTWENLQDLQHQFPTCDPLGQWPFSKEGVIDMEGNN